MVATTNAIAKIAAVVAGLGLVAMSFAAVATPAQAADTTFTMDLTIGSTGAEVTALQTWLISKGYSIPAGATGYFGAQTQSALAAYQAANGISPAAGYFGPITRAKVNAAGGASGSTGAGGTSSSGLSGGEADLRNFDLLAGDDLMEGDEETEIAIAKFDVDGGDVRVQRVTVDFQATSGSYSEKPWDYVDTLAVVVDGKVVGDVDAGSKSDWDKEDDDTDHSGSLDFYTIDIPVDVVIEEGEKAELSIVADAQSSIDDSDEDQTFSVQVPDDGIRATDAEGIQQYTGDGEEITLGFDAAENGDLTVKKSSDTPEAGTLVADDSNTSDEFDVLKFEIKNTDEADALLTDLTVSVATGSPSGSPAGDITDIIRRATLTVDGDDFDGEIKSNNTIEFEDLDVELAGDDTTDFTLSVQLFGQTGHYLATGETLTFSVSSGNVTAEGADTGDAASKSGTATGYQQSIAVNGGITVTGNDTATNLVSNDTITNSYGTFTLKFDVEAIGDDVYVPKTIATSASTTAGVVVVTSMSASTTSSTVTASLTTTADSDNGSFYVVHDGDVETFTATVTINPTGTSSDLNTFQVGLDKVRFSSGDTEPITAGALQTVEVDQTDADFHTDPLVIAG